MESILNQPENRPIKEARLTAFGQMFMKGKEEGMKEGLEKGERRTLHQNIIDICPLFSIRLTPARRKQLDSLELAGLKELWQHLLAHHAWPR